MYNIRGSVMGSVCSKCKKFPPTSPAQKYCRACRTAYTREWRKTSPLAEAQRIKDIARSYAAVYRRRGKLIPQPCEVCSSTKVEMHHDDYDKPLMVRWLCRPHHLEHHKNSGTKVSHWIKGSRDGRT